MTGTTRSSANLTERQRRLLFRSWHRGIRETDLLLGRFADAHIADMTDGELDEYERLLEVQDQDIYGWVTGEIAVPPSHHSALLDRIRTFHAMSGEIR